MNYTQKQIYEIIEQHRLWLIGDGGCRANLSGANLSGADLSRADLSRANLWACVGNKKHIKSIQIEGYDITYTHDVLQIGCQRHLISEWFEFDDRRILDMDGKTALTWWCKWKDYIKMTIDMSLERS